MTKHEAEASIFNADGTLSRRVTIGFYAPAAPLVSSTYARRLLARIVPVGGWHVLHRVDGLVYAW